VLAAMTIEGGRGTDLGMLQYILAAPQEPEVEAFERSAFREMLTTLESRPGWQLMPRQRAWVVEVYKRLQPIDLHKIPKGRPVATPEVLRRPLPLKPPRKREE
jgi:hypothetical protein